MDKPWEYSTIYDEDAESRLHEIAIATVEIRLQRDWSGYGSPSTAHYSLVRGETEFSGNAEFTHGYVLGGEFGNMGLPCLKAAETFDVSFKIVADFLEKMGSLKLIPGPYYPFSQGTDSFPFLRIELESRTGLAVFESESHGEGHVPWGLTLNDGLYTVNTATPDQAMAALECHMKSHRRDELQAEFRELSRKGR